MEEIVFRDLTAKQADEYGLVLTSYGLPYSVRKSGPGWAIWVAPSLHDRAIQLISRYLEENQPPPTPATPNAPKTYSALWVALVLLAVHTAIVLSGSAVRITDRYGASAEAIMNGETYRCVTALMLHSNYLHQAPAGSQSCSAGYSGIWSTQFCSNTAISPSGPPQLFSVRLGYWPAIGFISAFKPRIVT